jgi:hypothetical protein
MDKVSANKILSMSKFLALAYIAKYGIASPETCEDWFDTKGEYFIKSILIQGLKKKGLLQD